MVLGSGEKIMAERFEGNDFDVGECGYGFDGGGGRYGKGGRVGKGSEKKTRDKE
jgi:hypothetical protein